MQILQRDTLHLNLLHQFLTIGIQSVQSINAVMRGLMCSRIIEHKERMEVTQSFLRGCTLHLLRLVHDDDGAVGCDHVNRLARVEVVPEAIDDTGFLVFCALLQRRVESLRVDNHHVDVGITAVAVYLLQVATVVDEVAGLFAIFLHEVVFEHGKTLRHTFTNGNAGHHHDKLCPAVALVQLKHSLDVNVGLTRTCFHLYVK